MISDDSIKPFIKKFTNDGLFYIYDVNTNQIVEVEKIVYDIVGDYRGNNSHFIENKYKGVYPLKKLRNSIEKIENAKKNHGLFSNFRPKMITMGVKEPEHVKKVHSDGLLQLLLEVTRDCNLKCRYCPVSGKYADIDVHRKHMSKEICEKAVDFFCQKTSDSRGGYITFYGGEPTLKFDLIRQTIEHVKQKYGSDKYSFGITTNGTLLNKEMFDFFIENDFYLKVSLDGPERIHNRYRVSRTGENTFNNVMKNLEFIKQYNTDYFLRNVSIISVFAPPFALDETLNFFSTDKTLSAIRNKGKIRSSLLDTRETSFLEDFQCEESMKEFRIVFDNLVERLKKLIKDKKLEKITFERDTVFLIINNLARRQKKKLHDYVLPFGVCHIGARRLFVDTHGYFNVCERAGKYFKIGCVHEGFDYEAIAGYYKKIDEVLADCRNCWAISHCERCWASIGNLDEFTGREKEEFCSTQKKIIEKAFKVYTELLREDPDCLKVFKENG